MDHGDLCIQWAKDAAEDWTLVRAADWASLPAKADPADTVVMDDQPGWINRICFQGVEFTADHYAVELDQGVVRIYGWSDSPARDGRPGYVAGTRYARVWEFGTLAPDARFGGAINTTQTQTIYAEQNLLDFYAANPLPGNATLLRWEDFVSPTAIARHGVWIPDALYQDHENIRTPQGWRDWGSDLDPKYLGPDGRVGPQRSMGLYDKPDGTRTYFHSSTALANGIHVVTQENELSLATAVPANIVSADPGGGGDILAFLATTPSGEPDSAAWPTGDYRHQLDVTAVGVDITYGLLTLGGSAGHFARVNTGLTSDLETKVQQEAVFSGTGLKLATTGSVSWTAGADSDRFEVLIAAQRAANHGVQTVTIQANETDDFADGPWVAAPAAALFFGAPF